MSISGVMSRERVRGLYAVTSANVDCGRSHVDVAQAAIDGGSRIVQFRDKGLRGESLYREAAAVRDACRASGAMFIVNDYVDLAMELGADGLHLGQSDLTGLSQWRPTWDAVLGISAATPEEVRVALDSGADYIGVGPVYETRSKIDAVAPLGIEGLRTLCSTADIPVAAIGGIDLGRVAEVVAAGASAVCVISAISRARDPRSVAADLVREYGNASARLATSDRGTSWD